MWIPESSRKVSLYLRPISLNLLYYAWKLGNLGSILALNLSVTLGGETSTFNRPVQCWVHSFESPATDVMVNLAQAGDLVVGVSTDSMLVIISMP